MKAGKLQYCEKTTENEKNPVILLIEHNLNIWEIGHFYCTVLKFNCFVFCTERIIPLWLSWCLLWHKQPVFAAREGKKGFTTNIRQSDQLWRPCKPFSFPLHRSSWLPPVNEKQVEEYIFSHAQLNLCTGKETCWQPLIGIRSLYYKAGLLV